MPITDEDFDNVKKQILSLEEKNAELLKRLEKAADKDAIASLVNENSTELKKLRSELKEIRDSKNRGSNDGDDVAAGFFPA